MLSGHRDIYEEEALASGAVEFWNKPVIVDKFFSGIERLLSN